MRNEGHERWEVVACHVMSCLVGEQLEHDLVALPHKAHLAEHGCQPATRFTDGGAVRDNKPKECFKACSQR